MIRCTLKITRIFFVILERGLKDLPRVIRLSTLVVDEDLQLNPVLDAGHPPQLLPQLLLVLLLQEAEEKSEEPEPLLQSRPGSRSVESGRCELGVSKTPRLGQQELLHS